MENRNTTQSKTSTLRQQAEALLKEQHEKANLTSAEVAMLKLIHELKVHQIELEQQNEELKLAKSGAQEVIDLYDFAPIGYFTLSQAGEIIRLNLCGAEMLGKERGLLQNSLFGFFVCDESKPTFNLFLEKVFKSKTKETCEVVLLKNTNLPVYVQLTGLITQNQETCLITTVDNTERKQAEEALRESEKRLNEAQKNAILNGISANFAFVDKDLKIIWANKTAAESVMKTPDEMVGQTCHHFWADPSKPCEECPTLKAFVSKKPEQTLMTTPDSKIWEERGEPIFDVNGNLIGVVEIATDVTARKRSEEKLRISEERYRLLAENSRDVIWTMKLDGTITYISPAVEQLRGFTVEEAMHQPLDKTLTPDSQAIVIEYLQRLNTAFKSGLPLESFRGENEYYCKDGSTLWTEVIVYPLPANDSGSVTMLGVTRDNTERRKAETALRKSEEMLRETGRMAKLGGWELDLTTMELSWTEETYRIHEVEPDQKPLLEDGINFYAPESRPILQRDLDLAIKQGVSFDVELPFITAKGNHLWVRSFGKADLVDGHPVRLFGVFQDITKRKEAESALRESEETYRSILQASPDDITITDLEGRILMVSPATLQILRCKDENELIGHFVDEFIFPDDRERAKNNIALMFQGIMTGLGMYRGLRADGSIFDMEANAEFIRDVNGQPNKILFIVRDISERKKAEQALQESEQRFRNNMEHFKLISAMLDTDGNITFANTYFLKLTGWQLHEVLGRNWFELFIPPQAEVRNVLFHQIEQGIIPLNYQNEILTRTGERRLIDWSNALLRNAQGNIVGIAGIGVDITDRKNAEDALAQSRSELKAIYEFSPVMMCLVDANRRIIFANPAFTALTGTSEEQLKGGHACGVFGCINAFNDVRGCGFGDNCRNCSLRLAMDDTLQNGTGHINVEY